MERWESDNVDSERSKELRTELVASYDSYVQSKQPSIDHEDFGSRLKSMYPTIERWGQSKKEGCQLTITVFVRYKDLIVTLAYQRPPGLRGTSADKHSTAISKCS